MDLSKLCTYYCRVSSDKDEQVNSIGTQTSGLIAYAKEKKMIIADSGVFCKKNQEDELRQGYIDEGFSGAKSKKYRRAYQQMILDAKRGLFKTILTKSVSRFGRNVKDMLTTIDELETYGVGVWFEDIKAYSLNGSDKVKIQLFATLAEEESRSKSDSVQWAKKEAAKRGVWAGREPYGYNIYKMGTYPIKDKEMKGKLVINPKEQEVVIKIFDLYLNGWGVNKIAKYLEVDEKIPSKRGGTWTGSHVAGILQNNIYTGHTTLHRTRRVNINMGLIEKVPEHKQIRFDDESLRVISDETFHLAQKERESRPKVKNMMKGVDSRYSSAHLFSNLLRCSNCGGSMRKKVQKTSRQTHHYYYCRNHEMYGNEVCRYRNLQREEELLEWVKSELIIFIEDTNNDHQENLDILFEARYENVDFYKLISQLEVQLSDLESDKDANFRLYSKDIIDEDEYRVRNNKIRVELEKIKSQIQRYQNINEEIEMLIIEYDRFLNELKNIDLDNLSNTILKKIFFSINIFTTRFPGNKEEEEVRAIHWKFMGLDPIDIINERVDKYIK
ncbi:hypothetical protein PMSD_04890 [Paenibacillus macquariensis subsp. defensor]|nr:hypothetical protein PMSD_04890 [Paenibacillus macquariensis subsp. defensor]